MAIKLHSSFAVHPGEWLREEIVEPSRLNVTALADHMDVARQSVSKLLNGRQGLLSVSRSLRAQGRDADVDAGGA